VTVAGGDARPTMMEGFGWARMSNPAMRAHPIRPYPPGTTNPLS
jgi:hypothetical protein